MLVYSTTSFILPDLSIRRSSFILNDLSPKIQEKMNVAVDRYNDIITLLDTENDVEIINSLEHEKEELRSVYESAKALAQIQDDLDMFRYQIEEGDNEGLKESARIFRKEFISCRDELEDNINRILDNNE